VLGGPRTREEAQAFETTVSFLGQLTDRWRNFDHYESVRKLGPQGELPPWNLFVQQQLGLIEIRPRPFSEKERRDWGGYGWLVGGARLTPWGTAAAWAMLEFQRQNEEAQSADDNDAAPVVGQPQLQFEEATLLSTNAAITDEDGDSDNREWDEGKADDVSDESDAEAAFGILQPVFQPYFPEWKTVYARLDREVRLGTHIFKVTLAGWRGGGGDIWRRIAVPPGASLDTLAGAILGAFKLDDDHLYDFRYRDRRGRSRVYSHPYTDEGPFTPEIAVGETELALKDKMRFTFDYGDYWQFDVCLERVESEEGPLRRLEVIESAGQAPEQYPKFEG
jgi:hypothetical protein